MAVTLWLSCSSDAQPEAQRPLCWVMAFFTASYQHLLRTSTHQSPKAPSAWCGFPYRISDVTPSDLQPNCQLPATQLATPLARRTQLNYIIVPSPLDLWNRMFNRHQAEITVMQFTGHSLPVHQSMSVPWEFFSSSHFISQFPPTRFSLLTAIGMCHFLPVHHLEWHFGPVQKVKIQQIMKMELSGHLDNSLQLYFYRILTTTINPGSSEPESNCHEQNPDRLNYSFIIRFSLLSY